jgi:hypothetical protein
MSKNKASIKKSGIGTIQNVVLLCLGFIVTSIFLNASGIRQWAQRLEIQDSMVPRTQLIELTTQWENLLDPTGLNNLRKNVMAWRALPQASEGGDVISNGTKINQSEVKPTDSKLVKETDRQKPSSDSGKDQKALETKQTDNKDITTAPISAMAPIAPSDSMSHGYIALTGDSMMAVSLGPHLAKLIEKNSSSKIIRAYKSGTGLSRPDVFNWLQEYPKFLAGKNPGLVICAIGANDAQGFEVNKKVIPFGSPAWDEEYSKRAESFIQLMLKNGAKVYWVLLPHMRSPVYSQKMQNLNGFLQEKFKNIPNLVFISPDALMVGKPVQSYVEFSPGVNQKMDRLRGDDGIHYSEMGGQRLAQGLWLKISQGQ